MMETDFFVKGKGTVLTANYHTHTPRCNHAEGSEREYIEQAIAAGLQILGFSDHTPQFFENGYDSWFRMRAEQLPDYIATVLALREEYRGRIDIRLGLEVEYYPATFSKLLSVLRETPVEYMLLGQHALNSEYDGPYSGTPTDDPAVLRRYTDQCIEAMRTGLFSCLAHPDLLNFIGDDAVYEAEARRLCTAAKECGVPLEINLLGLAGGRNYPNERFWKAAGETGAAAILGCDAHRPAGLHMPVIEAEARALAARCGVLLLDTLPLRPLQ